MNPEPGLAPGFFITQEVDDPCCRLIPAEFEAYCGDASSRSPTLVSLDIFLADRIARFFDQG